MAKLFESIGKLGLALAIGGGVVNSALYNGESKKEKNESFKERGFWFTLYW